MATFTFNRSLGRVVELHNRVKVGDPAASRLVVCALSGTGLESDAVLKQKDTFADIILNATNELTTAARKVYVAADLTAYTPDDANSRTDLKVADFSFAAVTAGESFAKLVICYDPSSAGVTNSLMVPLTCHDFVHTPTGAAVPVAWNANGFFRSSPV